MSSAFKPYRYVKADPFAPKPQYQLPSLRYPQFVAGLFIVLGVGILAAVATPIIGWQLTSSKSEQLVSPIIPKTNNSAAILGVTTVNPTKPAVQVKTMADGFSYFQVDTQKPLRQGSFTVDIPKIGIKDAVVLANTNDFDTHLGHLPGSAFPGEVGNVFISGHSALPAFYSPTNYKTIFTHLPDISVLDQIVIYMGDQKYTYSVEQKTVVDPSDVSVINPPNPFGKYLTLMTCVPPGTNTKRLIVLARLVE